MIHCSNCNFELPESAKFCPECGTPYTPEVKSTVDTPEAALREKNVCDKCGLELPIGAKFCTICGGKAIKDTSVITPTSCIIGGAAASAAVSGGMMESVAVEAVEETPAAPAPAPEAAPFGETVAPFVADISAPAETPAAAPFAAPVVDIPEIAEMGEIPEIAEIPEMGAIPEMPAENTAPVTPTPAVAPVPTVNTIQQPVSPTNSANSANSVSSASPLSQPIAPTQPVSAISQPVSATQPVSASPIIPPVSGTATAVMPNPAPVNPANSLNPNVQTGAMPTYNAASAVNLGKGGSAVNYVNPVNNANTAASSNNAKSGKKKMPIGGKIGIIAGSLVAACAVAAGVFFALDRATFLSTLLGKEKYAVMVESKAITDVANRIDTQSISEGVEVVSSVYSAMATTMGDAGAMGGSMIDIEDMSNTAASQSAVPMMYVGSTNSAGEIDMAAYIKAVNELYLKTYGVNSIKEQVSIDVEVGDALIDLAGGDSATIREIEKLINNTEIACGAIVDENAMQVTYDIKLDQATVDCKVIMNSDNEMYIALPFVSDKAFLMKLPVPSEEVKEPAALQLDKAELTRIIGEVVQSYLMNYKSAAIEMEEGSVKIADVTVSGKEITAEFEGELLEKLFTDIAEIIAKDEYLKNKILDYCNEIGVEMTAEKYETAIMDAIEFEAGDGDKLVITTIIDKKGNILAKTIEAVDKDADDTEAEKVTVGWTFQEKVAAFEMTFGDEGKVVVKADIMNESDFDMTVEVESDGEQMVFNINCMGVKTEQYCGKEVPVGTCVISMELPESFEDQLGSKEAFAAINNMMLTFSTRIEGNTQNAYVRLDVSKYGSVQFNVSAAAENDAVSEYPTDVIDLTPVLEQGTLDDAAMGQLKDYLDEVGVAYDGIRNALSGYSIFEELPEYTNPLDSSTGPAHGDDALTPDDILQYIEEDLQELAEYTLLVDSSNTEMLSRIIGLVKKYSDLSENVKQLAEASAETEGYAEALAAAEEQYWELFDELWDIEIEIDESSSGQSLSDMLPSVNAGEFTKMDYTELYGIMLTYNAVFDTIKDNEKELIIDDKLLKLYDTADYARIDVDHDWTYFYESLNRGNLNINLLNNLRNSMKDYVPAVNALVDELEARGLA
ncbi:MAG: zinc ribbon domain-containing protein [Oscillospiraceae bacterium]